MKHLLLSILFLGFLGATSLASAENYSPKLGDPGPFPWKICEFPLDNMYGVWSIHGLKGNTQSFIKIDSIKSSRKTRTIIVTQYAYSPDFKTSLQQPISQGVGILSKSKLEFTAQMSSLISPYRYSYLLYFRSYCDKNGRHKHEILEVPLGGVVKDIAGDRMVRQKSFDDKN